MSHGSFAHAAALFLALGATVLGGCSSMPTIEHPASFYLQEPATLTFDYERTLPEQSWIKGTLILDVESVEKADGPRGKYAMAGTLSLTTRGRINGRSAAPAAPRDAVQAAMEPDNVPEVFETVRATRGMTVTSVNWNRLRTLRLPIEFEDDHPASPFNSSLRGDALDNAAEIALVWHKVIALHFSIPPFGTFTAEDVREGPETLELTLVQAVPGGGAFRFRYRFARGRGLRGFDTTLQDGSALRVTIRE